MSFLLPFCPCLLVNHLGDQHDESSLDRVPPPLAARTWQQRTACRLDWFVLTVVPIQMPFKPTSNTIISTCILFFRYCKLMLKVADRHYKCP
jgi:hypothetical protein